MTNNKEIYFGNDARNQIMAGIDKICDTIKKTMGPGGRNILIEKQGQSPSSTRDGVSVARSISLVNPVENMGAALIKEIAEKTVSIAGDGTSASAVLSQMIFKEGLKAVASGANPVEIKRGIEKAVELIVKELENISIQVSSKKELTEIGIIAANDEEIGKIIAEGMDKIGKDGILIVEESNTKELSLEIVEGIQIDKGYISPYFVNNQEKLTVEFDDCYILLYEEKINTLQTLIPILEKNMATGKPLLIICENIEGEALAGTIVNKLKGILKICAIKSPGFGERKKDIMADLAILTGGTVINNEIGIKLEDAEISHLGKAKRVVVEQNNTLIIDGAGDSTNIANRIKQMDVAIEAAKSDYEKERLSERKAKLSGGVGIIRIGALTETEMKEKKDRAEDALYAVRAAVSEGVVPGGGTALIRCQHSLKDIHGLSEDQKIGVNIIKRAIEEPLRVIAGNAGLEGSIVIEKVRNASNDINFGFNAKTQVYEDLVLAGVIDPTKVIKTSLQHAASIASLLLITEAVIIDSRKEETKDNQPMPDMGGMF